jgi:hypothetical protein
MSSCSSFISLRIWAWVVTSSAVVGSSAMSRLGRQEGHGDHRPLPHAAAQLERVGIDPRLWAGDAHMPEHLDRAGTRGPLVEVHMQLHILHDLVADRMDRTQRCHGLLEDHGDLPTPDAANLLAAWVQLRDIDGFL